MTGVASVGPCCGVVTVDIESTAPRLSIARAVAVCVCIAAYWCSHVASLARGVGRRRLAGCASDGGRGDDVAVGTGGANSAND